MTNVTMTNYMTIINNDFMKDPSRYKSAQLIDQVKEINVTPDQRSNTKMNVDIKVKNKNGELVWVKV